MNICFQLLGLILWILFQQPEQVLNTWRNAGFEGNPGKVSNPLFWRSCSNQSTPDLLPGIFDVETQPFEGGSYVGLITRSNGQKEDIYQELSEPFEKGQCYQFSLRVARSATYLDHNTPVGLKVWLGSGPCLRSQLIHHEKMIKNLDWEEVEIQFTADKKMRYILFEPSSAPGLFFDYPGNVLLDDLSQIESCNRS
ncbi:MAG TPA: hypothetical protein VJ917_04740 [Saprospiraceae bacterium]|nr:hypothetical protein [Saprospiraceae bacterium]